MHLVHVYKYERCVYMCQCMYLERQCWGASIIVAVQSKVQLMQGVVRRYCKYIQVTTAHTCVNLPRQFLAAISL